LDRRAAVKEMQLECETVSIKEDGGGEATINSICAPFNAQIPETGPPPVRVIPSAVVGGKESPGRIMDSAINQAAEQGAIQVAVVPPAVALVHR